MTKINTTSDEGDNVICHCRVADMEPWVKITLQGVNGLISEIRERGPQPKAV